MLLTFHTLAGATIASQVSNPLISWPLALLSHFVLDIMPHWDFFTNGSELTKLKRYAVYGDFLLGLSLGLFFALRSPNFTNMAGACFFACLPDGLEAPYLFWRTRFWLGDITLRFQKWFHWKMNLPWGLAASFLVAAGSLIVLLG